MHIYISKYLYFYEIKKMTKLQMSLYSSSDIERATQLFMDRRTSLSLPGPSCTVESMHHHCWREQDSKGERTVCSPQWHSVLSQPRNAVRECFSALVFHVDPDTGRQHTDTLVPSHKAPCTTRQREGQYNQQDLSYQKGFYLLGNTRILMFS